ncbi:MAG: phosphoglycolate phosphatase [Patescibacteria group bacterium]|nr:MAG: phosphoglycolate phosphatase [Patescibacteria group bacterium]
MRKKIKAIIFDFDGTIADTLPYTFEKIIEIARKYKIKEENKIIEKLRSMTPNELLRSFNISWLKYPFIIWDIKKAQKLLFYHLDKIKVFSGIKKVLQLLNKKNIKVFIYSSNLKKNIDYFLEKNDLKKYFEKVYVGNNLLGKYKDLKNILKKERLKKNEVVYVADEIRDVLACKKVGIKMIGVGWGLAGEKNLKKYKVDFIIKKPLEIIKVV